MSSKRADEIRKRMAQKQRERERMKRKPTRTALWAEDEERYGFDKLHTYDGGSDEGGHPLFNRETFLFKLLASACLFLVVAILFKNVDARFEPARNFIVSTMEKDFQFAAVADWYEEQFGKPLALLPLPKEEKAPEQPSTPIVEYALPASARILEDFNKNRQWITIETNINDSVIALEDGLVTFTGVKDGFGKTIVVQHSDNSESWYGNLAEITAKPFTYIEKGTTLGRSQALEDAEKASFYFAIKKGDDFIDPIQVIPFE